MKKYLELGKVVGLHGLRGEVRCQYYCDSADFFCDCAEDFGVFLDKRGENHINVTRAYPHKHIVVVQFENIDSPEAAKAFVGTVLYLDRDNIELDEGVYFIQDILGLTVKDADSGKVYGRITDVYQNGPTDVYSMRQSDGSELMFPCIPEVVLEVDLDAREMTIRPLKGLFDNDEDDDENGAAAPDTKPDTKDGPNS